MTKVLATAAVVATVITAPLAQQKTAEPRFYLKAHIPGAIYVHLDHDLAAPIIPGVTGRHPLPSIEECARRFGLMGIGPDMQVVAYDDQGGALAARPGLEAERAALLAKAKAEGEKKPKDEPAGATAEPGTPVTPPETAR